MDRRQFIFAFAVAAGIAGCKRGERSFRCDSVAGLSAGEIETRRLLKYTDATPIKAKRCDNCALYRRATGGRCGGCKALAGPVHPAGYCTSWVAI